MKKIYILCTLACLPACAASQLSPDENRCLLNADAAYQIGVMQQCKSYDMLGDCEAEKELFNKLQGDYDKCLKR